VIAVNLSADFRPQSIINNQIDHGNNQKKTSDFFKRSQQQIQQWFKKSEDADQETIEKELLAGDEFLTEECLEILEPVNIEHQNPRDLSTEDNIVVPPAPSIINAMTGSLDILSARVTRSRLAGDPPDILIEPQLGDFGMMEFYRAKELIEHGRASVQRIANQIKYQLGAE
jgi:NTE family protein